MSMGRKSGRWVAALGLLLGLGVWCVPGSATVVDRTIAVVNKHLVTWSDLDEQMRFEALENRRPLKELTEAERHAAFNRLVEDWILRDQMQGTAPATATEVKTRIAAIRADWGLDGHTEQDEAKWAATIQSYGLSPQELRTLVANQLEILRFLEFQVRPLVSVSRQEVEDYYNKTLAPEVRAKGESPEPEREVAGQIRELLSEQKMNLEMEKWIDNLRLQSQVQILWDGVQ